MVNCPAGYFESADSETKESPEVESTESRLGSAGGVRPSDKSARRYRIIDPRDLIFEAGSATDKARESSEGIRVIRVLGRGPARAKGENEECGTNGFSGEEPWLLKDAEFGWRKKLGPAAPPVEVLGGSPSVFRSILGSAGAKDDDVKPTGSI